MLEAEALDEREADELAHVVLLRLAAEFQGFCRDLHNECIDVIFGEFAAPNRRLELLVSNQNMRYGRRLDTGNATKDGIGSDFLRLGLRMWVVLESALRDQVQEWLLTVHLLNAARNAIAHNVDAKLDQLRQDGHSLSLSTALRWRSSLDALAVGMDTVCNAHLRFLLPEVTPW
ncbi:hypothetical protein L6E12_13035 [Actinokineospora sp. PR83]|uniref:hypothetical protein n=1 Tax=Actinokineospora sp. PR83 TaxID=2884908 RepID=UPI001F227560|nr:hypothetical protein [Actinokineospora sp. PR83]MCG8916716.1 hypothetical protein [Actinokineospora sp. PR83]